MKKVLKYFSVMLAFVLVLTGCSFNKTVGKSAKDTVKSNLEKTDKAKNYSEKVSVDVSFETDGQKISANSTIDGKVYTEGDNTLIAADVKVGASGMTLDGKLYVDATKDSVKLYVNYMGQWIKADTSILGEEFKNEMAKVSTEKVSSTEILDYAKEVKEEKSDKEGYKKYVVTLDKDKVNNKYKETLEKTIEEAKKNGASSEEIKEMEDEIAEYKNGILSKDFALTLYTKDGYVVSTTIDFSTILDNVLGSVNDEEVKNEIKKMNITGKITVELGDFDKVEKITIPEEAKNGQDIMTLFGSAMSTNSANIVSR